MDLAAGTLNCQNCGTVPIGWKVVSAGVRAPRCSVKMREHNLIRPGRRRNDLQPHGLTSNEARELKRGKVCTLCGTAEKLHVDHDHATGKRRDILCVRCNVGLGCFSDDPDLLRAAADYIEKHRG